MSRYNHFAAVKYESVDFNTLEVGQTGESVIKINEAEARQWFDDGATPYQTFRETWNME